jgi:hypothetical protein
MGDFADFLNMVRGRAAGEKGLAISQSATLLCLFLLVSCGGELKPNPPRTPVEPDQRITVDGIFVMRFHDDEKGATCWASQGYNSGGISCIPDEQLSDE